jgi:cytochrome P450
MTTGNLPPGDGPGLPILGQTLAMLKNGFAFVEEGARRHGPIFQAKVFGKPTAIVTGPDASGLFIDADRVQRSGGMPSHIQALFGGRALPLLDGPEHRDRKRLVMAAFTEDALAAYLPALQKLVADSIAGWSDRGEIRLLDELKSLAIESVMVTMLGISRGPVLDAVLADYELVGAGFASLPVPLPGTAFTKAKKALARILAVYERCYQERQARPTQDGLSRILAARTEGGRPITVEEARMEVHHLVVAGLIVWAWFVEAILELDRRPDLKEKLLAEIRGLPPGSPALPAIGRLHGLQSLTMEIRRLAPVIFVLFGKARRTFEFAGYTVPEGWQVLWGLRSSHLRPEVFREPETFDPSRFDPPRAEHRTHPHAFVPNGAGPTTGHLCAGYEFAPLLLQVFLIELYRSYDVSVAKPQNLELDWSRIPPEPRDGLRATIRRRTS